jgi:hypothetical protein
MIDWFMNLSDTDKIAIVVPVAIVVIGGLFTLLFKCLFRKKDDPQIQQTKNEVENLQKWYQSIGPQFNNCTFNISDKAKMPDEIKEILTKCRDQENENG